MPIAHFAVTRRVTVAMLATAITILGIFAVPRLAVSLLPSFSPPVVTVTINYTNVAPQTIETTVTRPVENAVSRVPGIDFLQSDSFEGQSVVRAQFQFGVNIDTAAIDIEEQVARIKSQLPNDPNLQPPAIVKADPNALPVVFMFATDERMTLRDLSDLIDNQLVDEFSAVPGVATVGTGGEAQRAIMIEPNMNALAGNQLTLSQLVTRVSAENVDLPAGIVQIGKNEYTIRTSELFQDAGQVGNIVVAVKNGAPIYLRDVARVSDSIEEQRIFTRNNGVPGVRMAVISQPDANIVNVANGVYDKIHDIEKRYPGMHFGVVLDQRGFIADSIAALEHTAVYGAVLAVLIILLFLHSYRSTIIVAVSLPVSILGTLFAAYAFGQTLNTMTMGGLALAVGLIVDDAIVVIENIFRHMEGGEPPLQAAEKATAQILTAVVASSITVITVFIPLMLIPGLQGLIFGPLALMVMTAVGISLVMALTIVPMLSSRVLRPEPLASNGHPKGWYARFSAKFDRAFERFTDWYRGILEWAIDHPGPVVTIGIASLVVALGMVKLGLVATEVFPQTNSRFVRLDVKAPVGTAVAVTDQVCRTIEAVISKDPLVVDVGVSVGTGTGSGGTTRQVTNQAQVFVTLKDGTSSDDAGRFVQVWQARLGGVIRDRAGRTIGQENAGPPPRVRAQFAELRRALIGTTVRARTIDIIQQQVSQGQDALQLQIFGPDVRTLFQTAQGAIDKLASIRGIPRPDTNITDLQPELDVNIDRRRAAQLGLSTGQIAAAINTATAGSISTYYELNGIQYPILVQLPPAQRRTFESVQLLQLPVPAAVTTTAINGGGAAGSSAASINGSTASVPVTNTAPAANTSNSLVTVPLTGVADVVVGNGPSQISRQNKQRRIDINAPVINRPLGEVIAEAGQIMQEYHLPNGYTWDYGPSIKVNNNAFSSLGLVVILAIALIYMLLASQFESYLHPLVIMMSVPLSLVGVVGSLFLTHRAFGLTAFIGTLMLVGIVVKNAILVVQFTNELRRQGMDPRDALMHAAPMRLRPILMTTLATVGGMVPLAFGFEAGSQTQAPLGTVVIGGLLTSTMLSLLVVPTLYLWSARHIESRFLPKPPRPTRQSGVQEPTVEPALG